MKLATPHPEQNHVGDELKQRVATQPHEGKNTQRQQSHGHDYDLSCDWDMKPHQLRITHEQEQNDRLYCVAGLQHAAQQPVVLTEPLNQVVGPCHFPCTQQMRLRPIRLFQTHVTHYSR